MNQMHIIDNIMVGEKRFRKIYIMTYYFIYKNCNLIYKCKKLKHAIRKYKRIRRKSNLRYDLLELMTKKHLLHYD